MLFQKLVCSVSLSCLSSLLFPSFLGEPCCSTLVPCRAPPDHTPSSVLLLLFPSCSAALSISFPHCLSPVELWLVDDLFMLLISEGRVMKRTSTISEQPEGNRKRCLGKQRAPWLLPGRPEGRQGHLSGAVRPVGGHSSVLTRAHQHGRQT